jgi:hypothetical protein
MTNTAMSRASVPRIGRSGKMCQPTNGQSDNSLDSRISRSTGGVIRRSY